MSERQTTCYRLTVAARLAGLSPTRLRRIERAGLIQTVEAPGRRLYPAATVARLRKIRRLSDDLGLNLAGVEVVLRLTEEIAALRAALAAAGRAAGDARASVTPETVRGDRR